ncbi:hypothetical protein PR001_g31521, partial [Phytophthora rubi]
ESRGYWKHHVPDKHFKQAKANSKINNVRAVALLDTGSEVSIIDATFARKVGCCIDTSQSQECLGIGEKLYIATGRTRIKLTLAGSLVYLYDVWVGDDLPPDYQVILGMDFMVPAGIRLDLGDGSMCLPDEIRVNLRGRRRIFSDKVRPVYVGEHLTLEVAESMELPLQIRGSDKEKLWLARGERWVPTIVKGPGKLRYLHVTNLSDKTLILQRDMKIGLWLAGDRVPRQPGFVSVGSRRYAEWQTLAWEATTDAAIAAPPALPAPGPVCAVDRVEYAMPRRILMRPKRFGDAPPEDESQGRSRMSTDCTLNAGQRQDDETSDIRSECNHAPSHAHVTTETHTDLTEGRNSAVASEGLNGTPTTRDGSSDAPSNSGPNEVRHAQFRGLGPGTDPPPDTAVAARVSSI